MVHRALAAAEDGAQGDHQKLVEVVQTGIPGSQVFQTLPARGKLIQAVLTRSQRGWLGPPVTIRSRT